ncbi:hypothetical protein PENPOL_c008G10585 [Penicillium polonicum]|uniref:Uncharacterized protein n=1 Tax=Penicillium polonicum TaxID=60169 RepID=A0A1V6NHV9_PENPO|nr:hypothetical protein PENPOL_c008G10585 [Penicillium polonicum]
MLEKNNTLRISNPKVESQPSTPDSSPSPLLPTVKPEKCLRTAKTPISRGHGTSPNSNFRTVKKTKDYQDHLTPSVLKLDDGTSHPDPPSAAFRSYLSHLDEAVRRAKIKRDVFTSVATTLDQFVASCKEPEKRAFALDVCDRFLQFVTVSDYVENNGADYVPIRVRQPTDHCLNFDTVGTGYAHLPPDVNQHNNNKAKARRRRQKGKTKQPH